MIQASISALKAVAKKANPLAPLAGRLEGKAFLQFSKQWFALLKSR